MEGKKEGEKPEKQLSVPETASPEALLEFQVETKEASIDRVLVDLKQVEKKNKEYRERNDRLKQEQQAHIRNILRQIEKAEKEQDEKEVVTREDVEESLKGMWQYVKDKEQLLKDLHSQIEETEQQLSVKQGERDYWLEYRNVGMKAQADRIMDLENDIKEVKDNFHKAAEYYRNALEAMKEKNDRLLENHVKLCKEQATKNAVRFLSKSSRREIKENEWLKEEVKKYQKEVSDLKASVQLLEEENVNLVATLIDGKLQNLSVPRHSFLTQTAVLQEEFPKDERKEVEYRLYAAKTDGDESLRSATVPCQKKTAFLKNRCKTKSKKLQDRDEELWERLFTPTLDSLLYEDEKDFQEHLKLGPLETQLMCVVGRAMPIHEEPEEMLSRNHKENGIISKSDGHITAQMIKALSKGNVG